VFAVHTREKRTESAPLALFTRKIRNAFGFPPSVSDFFSLFFSGCITLTSRWRVI